MKLRDTNLKSKLSGNMALGKLSSGSEEKMQHFQSVGIHVLILGLEALYLHSCLLQLRLQLLYRDISLLYLRRQLRNLRAQTSVVGQSFEKVVYDFDSGYHKAPNEKR